MLKTKPIMKLFERAQAVVARRIRRDRGRASEELRPVFDHIGARFYDVDLTVDDMVRKGVVDGQLRERFREQMGVSIKPYLQRLKAELGKWLLWKTHLQVQHVAELLGYSCDYNFTRDFGRWTGQSPEAFRDAQRGWSAEPGAAGRRRGRVTAARERICSRLGIALPAMREQGLAAVAPGTRFVYLPDAQAEEMAQLLWEIVREETVGRQLHLLRHELLFGGPELFELLSRRSRELGRRNRRHGVELAELALATVEGSAAVLGERYGALHALALARLGNARRLAGDLQGANEAFQRGEALWAIPDGVRVRHVETEILSLKASLRLFERRFAEALELLDRTLDISRGHGDVEMRVNSLLQRIALNGYLDRPQEMFPDLDEVQALLETQTNPDRILILGIFQERTLANLETGNSAEAKKCLTSARALCKELDHPMTRHQLEWIEGRLAQDDGEVVMAERFYRQARVGFFELGDRITGALAAVDIAILCHQQGRFPEVMALITGDVLPVLEEVPLRDEAVAAIELLREAVAAEAIALASLHKAREALWQLHRDPARHGEDVQ